MSEITVRIAREQAWRHRVNEDGECDQGCGPWPCNVQRLAHTLLEQANDAAMLLAEDRRLRRLVAEQIEAMDPLVQQIRQIRDLHHPVGYHGPSGHSDLNNNRFACEACSQPGWPVQCWPCATARVVYPEGEIAAVLGEPEALPPPQGPERFLPPLSDPAADDGFGD